MTPRERFDAKVDKSTDGCWWWTGCTTRTGYGLFPFRGKLSGAHRVAYELSVGPIPDKKHVCHKCDNRNCMNPDHLFLGTHQDNMDDKCRKQRQVRGHDVSHSKLVAPQVAEIRRRYAKGGVTQALGREFGVTQVTVGDIVRNETWSTI